MSAEQPPDWGQIVQRHAERVYRIAFRILGSVHDAEDVSQNVFTEAVRMYSAGPIQAWTGLFVRLATLRAIDMLRQKRHTAELQERDRITYIGPPEEAVGVELADWLRTASAKLPEQQAAVFSLTYFERLDRDEVAAILTISPETVSTALSKARQNLMSRITVFNEGR